MHEQIEDPFSIITLNWDTLLDLSLYSLCKQKSTESEKLMPDLCFYNYDKDSDSPPSPKLKAEGYFNIKLLKLHGSINWLTCSNCNRIITSYKNNIAFNCMHAVDEKGNKTALLEENCDFCEPNGLKHELSSLIITPTFLKDFSNVHLSNVWFNAGIEISEATKIVFVGYSLPDADFYLRYLLKKNMRSDVEIDVVLCNNDNPVIKTDLINYLQETSDNTNFESLAKNIIQPPNRYKSLFGNQKVNFYYDGAEEYFSNLKKETFA